MTISTRCPIVRSYVQSIRQFVENSGLRSAYELELDRFDAVLSDERGTMGGHMTTARRAFMCIEWMLEAARSFSWHKTLPTVDSGSSNRGLFLNSSWDRSWDSLTSLKLTLEELSREAALDRAELQLAGVVQDDSKGLVTAHRSLSANDVRTVLHTADKAVVVENTLAAVLALRPYLNNDRSPVSVIGKNLYSVSVAVGVSMEKMVNRLVDLTSVPL